MVDKACPDFVRMADIRSWAGNPGEVMKRIIRCECGFIARGDSDDDVVEGIRGHMKEDHRELFEQVSVEDVKGWIELE